MNLEDLDYNAHTGEADRAVWASLKPSDNAPLITIFVRHAADCKYVGDEFCKRCDCKKHFRWTRNGKQFRKAAGTRVWAEADRKKRELEDAMSGKAKPQDAVKRMTVEDACERFMQAKKNEGLEQLSLDKLQKVTDRIQTFCIKDGLTFADEIDLTHVSNWNWDYFKTTHSQRTNQGRVRAFFRFLHTAGVISKNPAASWKRIRGKTAQVKGLEPEQFEKILDTVPVVGRKITRSTKGAHRERHGEITATTQTQKRLRALILLMRYAGLAIIDAVCLERHNLRMNPAETEFRVHLKTRQKVSKRDVLQAIDNRIPAFVGKELLAVLNGNPKYFFWNRGEHEAGSEEAEKADGNRLLAKVD
jgi:integrase/recombinase XerD